MNRSLFISFEGIDGCGKSTQVKMLMNQLDKNDIKSLLVREPGGTPISEEIREVLLKNRDDKMAERTEALLMTASRAQLTQDIIIPSLNSGLIVIADRFKDSTLAYQGGGRGVDLGFLVQLNEFATYDLDPDITFFIDITSEEGRKRQSNGDLDRIENAGLSFQEKVREQYLKLAHMFSHRFIIIDGVLSPDEIHQKIWSEIQNRKSL
ncbi:MAG: dTMP kinase [Candidatus Marinimicrobia bacterium]|jgi:dTMP kinase|nr:dTMP kinase [Candidatus Neomarinimicrobiota bacterium]MBT3502276.1 dTMP kinase [Candidatus Neomarinimicrobiota bacterium]MBT3840354.1 dTMP kinase [Candidatus Neomarinimicrobiota bacterium]MBT3998526.1 dTMP kinase [Candidatus Neomarinimicrobiota bacterium]MBT4578988.1 dTMP kinase [Candidatus Neomarinimicrobiota bacterium]